MTETRPLPQSAVEDTPSLVSHAQSERIARMFEEEAAFVWRLVSRFGVPARDAEDVTHEVFLTAWQRLDSYDSARPLRPWLFGIAFRVASRFRELARNQRELLVEAEPELERPAHDEAFHARRLLDHALQGLDLAQRAVFVMHDMEGWSMVELSEALAIPLNTGYSRLRLARAHIKAKLLRAREGDAP